MNTVRHIVTDNVTAERKHVPKSNILSYHNILFLFLPFFEETQLKNSNATVSSKSDE